VPPRGPAPPQAVSPAGFAARPCLRRLRRPGRGPIADDHGILALLDEGASDTQAAIADALEVDRGQLVGLLDALEAQGLIERHRDPNDRRRLVVSLTAAGRRRLTKLRAVLREVEESVLAPLDADARAALRGLLQDVARRQDCAIGRV
jgi:DNA-binding MarR family transcriptional regulator